MVKPPVVVLLDRNDEIARLVRALREVEACALPQHAAVGGLAVMTRLAQAHRVTADGGTALRNTTGSPAVRRTCRSEGSTKLSSWRHEMAAATKKARQAQWVAKGGQVITDDAAAMSDFLGEVDFRETH